MDNKLVEKILALDEIEGLTVADYADKVRDLVNSYTPDPEHNFPNGFENWHETHFQICEQLFPMLIGEDNDMPEILLNVKKAGSAEVMQFARELADKFETKNKDREWDGEFYDEIELFVKHELQCEHNKDNEPYTIVLDGNKYPSREVFHKEKDTFLIVATTALGAAIENSIDRDEAARISLTINWFADEEDFLKTDEELINIIFA